MFYFLSKTLFYLLTPAGWVFFALIGAVFLRNHPWKQRFMITALALFWLLGNGPLVNEVMRVWEVETPVLPLKTTTKSPSVAVILTGGMINGLYKPTPIRPVFSTEADRAGQALWLYKTGRVRKIMISGGQGNLAFQAPGEVDEGQMIRIFLETAGVPGTDILLENKSKNTHENAQFSALMLRQNLQTGTCVLVTSAWHMRRARACFQKQGITVVPWPAAQLSERRATAPGAYLLPSEKAFHDAHLLFRELVGYATYWVVGYLD
ncbi:MAG: YdcF family protein [Rudanella sp.]|nr:YdcF family protein [Rudanella sp.]